MKTETILLTVLLLAGPVTLPAQGKTPAPTTQQLIEQLGDPDYQTRKGAERQLLERGAAALQALKKSAAEHRDAEVQWRAGRLVRRIEAGAEGDRKGLEKREGWPVTPPDRVEKGDRRDRSQPPPVRPPQFREPRELLERLDRAFDGHGFDADVRAEIERVMRQMRERMRGIDAGPGWGRGLQSGTGRSTRIEQGPDGVRVEITETDADGNESKKVYEAESMAALRKKHPGVLKDHGIRFGFGDRIPDPFRGGFPGLRPAPAPGTLRPRQDRVEPRKELRSRDRNGRVGEPVEQPAGKKLGFHVGAIAPAVRDYLQLDGGLMVADVVADTIAARIGLRQGDIVVQVGKRQIAAVDDVARALAEIGDGEVVVKAIRRGREITLR
jgi:hypothetical protein